jgi:hypothetical protein
MLMVSVNENELEFVVPGEFANSGRICRGVYANGIRQMRNDFRYLKTDRLGGIDNATSVPIDRIDEAYLFVGVSTMKGGRDHRSRKTSQGPNLDRPLWSDDTREGGQKKKLRQIDRSRMRPAVLNCTQKFHLTRRWQTFATTQQLAETRVLDLVILQRIKLADSRH